MKRINKDLRCQQRHYGTLKEESVAIAAAIKHFWMEEYLQSGVVANATSSIVQNGYASIVSIVKEGLNVEKLEMNVSIILNVANVEGMRRAVGENLKIAKEIGMESLICVIYVMVRCGMLK
jgi:flagellar biosynthesis/type III secretory pathway protein FliH